MNLTYFNTGIYTVRDAARLTGVSTGRIRRWLRGYRYRSRKKSDPNPTRTKPEWGFVLTHVLTGRGIFRCQTVFRVTVFRVINRVRKVK